MSWATALVVIIRMIWFKELVTTIKLGTVALIILGVVGLERGSTVRQ